MLKKDLEEIAELEAANEELEAYRQRLLRIPAAPPSEAALALLAEEDDEPGSAAFRDGAAARKTALLAKNKCLRVAVDAREPVVVALAPAPVRRTQLAAWMKPSLPMVICAGILFSMTIPFWLRHCLSD